MRKLDRQKVIKRIIIDNEIETQDELLNYLKEEGLQPTQATISRDMRELNIVKSYTKEGKKKLTLIVPEKGDQELEEKLKKSIVDYGNSLEQVNFLVILHTKPNGADVIANYMDEVNMEEVVATMAGYDTMIIVTRSEEIAKQFLHKLDKYLDN